MNLIGGKQTGKEDEVSWGIVPIYLKVEMKKCRVNFDWLITRKNFLGTNCTVCVPHMKNMFLASQLAYCAVAAKETQQCFVVGICHNFYFLQL